MKKLVLGIIGGSAGNGHPFSWSAIFNGYDEKNMGLSGYPIISEYLGAQSWPNDMLVNGSVDFVFTQNKHLSELIAQASLIRNVIDDPVDMIGSIDGLLLARDDAENHYYNAKCFLESGIPIFIDKPIALNTKGLLSLWSLQKYKNQIFSCSALSHCLTEQSNKEKIEALGKIRWITAITPNCWNKYGVHIIEPLIHYFQGANKIRIEKDVDHTQGSVKMSFSNIDGVEVKLVSLGLGIKGELKFIFGGENGELTIYPNDYFSYFKKSLERFTNNLSYKKSIWETSLAHHKRVVSFIELGAK